MTPPTIALAEIVNLLIVLFVVLTMLSIGLGLTVGQVLATASRGSLMARALLVNIVLIPVLAFVLVRVLPIDPRLGIGILLMAMAPGAAYGPKLTQIARASIALSASLVAVLSVLVVVTLPATAALILPGETAIDSLRIARSLVLVEILPLALGLVVGARFASFSRAVQPPVTAASTILLVLVILATVAVSWSVFPSLLQPAAIFVATLLLVGSLVLGYWLGGPGVDTRRALAITSVSRYAGIALFVAETSFPDPHVTAMIVAFGVLEVLVATPLAVIWGRQQRPPCVEVNAEEAEEVRGRAA